MRLSDAGDVDFECPIELEDPQNHLIKEASRRQKLNGMNWCMFNSIFPEIMLQATWQKK